MGFLNHIKQTKRCIVLYCIVIVYCYTKHKYNAKQIKRSQQNETVRPPQD